MVTSLSLHLLAELVEEFDTLVHFVHWSDGREAPENGPAKVVRWPDWPDSWAVL